MDMEKPALTIPRLIEEAEKFCIAMSAENHVSIEGQTDGKAVGTYVEQRLKEYLSQRYEVILGSSSKGIDLPGETINTDIKVTSSIQPQSSSPFTHARQKIYGLGYNLLVLVYEKTDTPGSCSLRFLSCTFIDRTRTGDYTITKRLLEMLRDNANREDIMGFLSDRNLPADDLTLQSLAEEIMNNPPQQGYLTISNALQWRLQYSRVLSLCNSVPEIVNNDL